MKTIVNVAISFNNEESEFMTYNYKGNEVQDFFLLGAERLLNNTEYIIWHVGLTVQAEDGSLEVIFI